MFRLTILTQTMEQHESNNIKNGEIVQHKFDSLGAAGLFARQWHKTKGANRTPLKQGNKVHYPYLSSFNDKSVQYRVYAEDNISSNELNLYGDIATPYDANHVASTIAFIEKVKLDRFTGDYYAVYGVPQVEVYQPKKGIIFTLFLDYVAEEGV